MKIELDTNIFRKNLDNFIETNHITVASIASKINVTPQRVYQWIQKNDKGEYMQGSMPSLKELASLSEIMGVSAREVLCEEVTFIRKVPAYNMGLLCLFSKVTEVNGFINFCNAFTYVSAAAEKSSVTAKFESNHFDVENDRLFDHVTVSVTNMFFIPYRHLMIRIPAENNVIEISDDTIYSVRNSVFRNNSYFQFSIQLTDYGILDLNFEIGDLRNVKKVCIQRNDHAWMCGDYRETTN